MVQRQSETDVAQLLSFTYHHKLNCFEEVCVCQYFTQYCQDPLRLKNRKGQQGFVDDGLHLMQEKILEIDSSQNNKEQSDRKASTQGGES